MPNSFEPLSTRRPVLGSSCFASKDSKDQIPQELQPISPIQITITWNKDQDFERLTRNSYIVKCRMPISHECVSYTYPVISHEGKIKFLPDQQATNNVLAPQPSTCWKGRATRKLHLLFEAGGQAAQGNKAVQMEPIGLESAIETSKTRLGDCSRMCLEIRTLTGLRKPFAEKGR